MQSLKSFMLFLLVLAITGCSCSEDKKTLTTSCSVHETRCGDECIDTKNDGLHCGGCNNACEGAEFCVRGACASSCDPGEFACAGRCVDLELDPDNCGECGQACGDDQVCSAGRCADECDAGMEVCDGGCVDTSGDPKNCGACGEYCGKSQVCSLGKCANECDASLEACDGSCVDTDTNPKHCGGCGEFCGKSQVCVAGACQSPCADGQKACGSTCTDTDTDSKNCGACGKACDANQTCNQGSCENDDACSGGETLCGASCVDTGSDAKHCGDCGVSCLDKPNTENGRCEEAVCEITCIEHHRDCDGDVDNGCEKDVRSDLAHCGACDNNCLAGAHIASAQCVGGGCDLSCEAGWGDCGASRGKSCDTNLNQNNAHCGACDNDCNNLPKVATTSCNGGTCQILTCEDGFGNCTAAPGCETDTDTSKAHCGGCNQPCDGACEDGVCKGIKSILAGGRMTCALMNGGSLYCWGENGNGQVGPGGSVIVKPQLIAGLGNAVQVSMGDYHACAVISDGSVQCWGKNNYGQLGRGFTSSYNVAHPTPEAVPNLSKATAVSAGKSGHSCALRDTGEIWCWGYNGTGDLGDGTKNDSLTPVRAGTVSNAVTLGLGWSHGCARLSDSTVSCWGESGAKMKLGRWENTNSPPAPVPNLTGVAEVTVGEEHSCARYGGQIKCWGNNSADALGSDGWNFGTWPPVMLPVVNISTATQMDAGSEHTCALLSSGGVACWGHNGDGQLGAAAGGTRRTPVQVPGISTAKQVVAGGAHSCVLLTNDEIRCWGSNWQGQLGDGKSGTANSRHTPAPVVW